MNRSDRRRIIEISIDTLIGKMDQTNPSIDIRSAGDGPLPGNLHFFPCLEFLPKTLCNEFRNISWCDYNTLDKFGWVDLSVTNILLQTLIDNSEMLLDIDWESDIDTDFIVWTRLGMDGMTFFTSLPESVETLTNMTQNLAEQFY